jgi:hypothetical protein
MAAAHLGAAPAAADWTFGSTPVDDVLAAAAAEVPTACGLTRDQLAAIVLAPTFPETGAYDVGTPSPMTLSRYDNQNGLHAFGNPDPAFRNAFFHPGVGAWQFDSAGAWGLSADATINTFTASALAADVMAQRYCGAPVGSTPQQRRARAWLPWHGCDSGACETIFNQLYTGGALNGVVRDPAVGRLGGMEQRTCRLINESTTFTCWYVDPGRAQGHVAFRSPNFGPSPVTAPFYVYARNGREYRHWLIPDSGYAYEISASKPLTANARTSLVWSSESMLCDVGLVRGTCDPLPPAGKQIRFNQALGFFTPIVGNFSGNDLTDIVWYSAPGGDAMWQALGDAQFGGLPINAAGTYTPLTGNFNGDGFDDIFWYSAAGGDAIWYGRAGGLVGGPGVSASGTYTPLTGNFNGDGFDDIFWYSAAGGDAIWYGRAGGFVGGPGVSASGTYTPLVADFNGDTFDDIFWYSAAGGDAIWYGRAGGFVGGPGISAGGPYTPLVGNFNGDAFHDVLWYSPTGGDAIWYGRASGFVGAGLTATGSYRPTVLDLDGNGSDDIIWYAPGAAGDALWRGNPTGFTGGGLTIRGTYQPLVGRFDAAGGEDVFWYIGDATPDGVWFG